MIHERWIDKYLVRQGTAPLDLNTACMKRHDTVSDAGAPT
jgi:hypothetical protein